MPLYDYKQYSAAEANRLIRTALANLARISSTTDRMYVQVLEATVVDLSPMVTAYATQQGISLFEHAECLQRNGWGGAQIFWGLPGAVAALLSQSGYLNFMRFGNDRIVMYTAKTGTMSWEQIMVLTQQPLDEKEN